jgi:polyhydroxyalkanoate synthase
MEGWISQLSFAGLMTSSAVSRFSSRPSLPLPLPDFLPRALAESHPQQTENPATFDPVRLINAVTDAAKVRFQTFAAGVARYQNHPRSQPMPLPPAVWQSGTACVRDYGGDGAPVLVVPSLINRATVLDLAPDRSLLRTMAAANLHTFLLDWGLPGERERRYGIDDYVVRILIPAIVDIALRTGKPVRLVGYCMGGTLAVAAAVLATAGVAKLALVAAPWDFHIGMDALRAHLTSMRPMLEGILATYGEAPFDLIQTLFASIDPALVGRKFRKFAALDPNSDEARRFVMLEDWLNDPVPLAAEVARACWFDWYGDNTPARGLWQVGGTKIDPSVVKCPSLALIPSRDRIVPPESAEALARVLPNADVRKLPLGHIGMMASGRAAEVTYAPLIAWLKDESHA